MTTVLTLMGQLQSANSEAEVKNCLLQLAEHIKFEFFLLGVLWPISATNTDYFELDNYPEAWKRHYKTNGYLGRDPVFQYAVSNYLPVGWHQLLTCKTQKPTNRDVLIDAKRFGLNSGFTVPIHGAFGQVGVMNFATATLENADIQVMTPAVEKVQLLIPTLQQTIKRIRINQLSKAASLLTKREIECLLWATEGKSAWEISKIIGCSEHTAIFHLKNASGKLGASNRYQAISKAILSGVVRPAFG
ncbi:LuxR family transcriptional regulator [Reinekea sp. G2M2-21]|uniref:helix-turn-helix transcriptional regulator n=1 Tax=Reinekea sp. G2M2-21 TaxID=2788942 RepID=UPI0018A920CF